MQTEGCKRYLDEKKSNFEGGRYVVEVDDVAFLVRTSGIGNLSLHYKICEYN